MSELHPVLKQISNERFLEEVEINDIRGYVSCNRRLSKGEKDSLSQSGFNLYELRHGETDWSGPITIEDHVLVNWYGTLITQDVLEYPDDEDFIDVVHWDNLLENDG